MATLGETSAGYRRYDIFLDERRPGPRFRKADQQI